MTYAEYKSAIDALNRASYEVEALYIENGGECTEETERLEAVKAELRQLLTDEGADFLGRWLIQKENEKAIYKAEKAASDARIKACEKSIEYIKGQIARSMTDEGKERIKGEFYSFAPSLSVTTKADTAAIKELYYERAVAALREAGIPEHITVTLGGSISAVPEGEETPDYFVTTERETVKFGKPRKAKEE